VIPQSDFAEMHARGVLLVSDEEHSSDSPRILLVVRESISSARLARPLIVKRFLFSARSRTTICFRQAGSVPAPLPGLAAASGIRDAIIVPQIRRRNPALTHKSFDPR